MFRREGLYFTDAMLILIISILLSFDAFAVGVTYGMKKICIPPVSVLIISLCSVVSGYVSVFLGTRIAAFFSPQVSNYIGSGILLFVGVWFLIQNIIPQACIDEKKPLAELAIKSLGITITIVRNPASMDLDKSGSIEGAEAFAIGIALAVDAASVGLGFGAANSAGMIMPLLIGAAEALFIGLGYVSGKKINILTDRFKTLSGILPGAVLIVIAVLKMLK